MCQVQPFPMLAHHSATCTCGCCGCGCGPFVRSFFTPAEEKERLTAYRDSLKKELAAVEEVLKKYGHG